MIDFNVRLERTPRSFVDNKRFLVGNNKEFLKGKSLLEFGVCTGYTLSLFSQLYDEFGIEKTFFGFDSFMGLPKENLDENNPHYWPEGAFSHGSSKDNIANMLPFVNIKDGWFENTLNEKTLKEVGKNPVGLFHIDCDIYTSTIQILEWVAQNNLLVDGALIVYDDWGGHYDKNVGEFECGEGKAHKEISEKYNLNFDFVSCDVIADRYHEVCTFRYNAN
jgi:hypothetical protein